MPERILSQANGSRGDLAFGAVWNNGTWFAEIARDLNTGNDDDIQFNTSEEYTFGVAEFDNSRHGYEHRTSKMYTFKFAPTVGIDDQVTTVPDSYELLQNYPNPFNPVTTISFHLPKSEFVSIKVFNSAGEIVASLINKQMQAGSHSIQWNASDVSSGVYYYKITGGKYSAVKKCIVLK